MRLDLERRVEEESTMARMEGQVFIVIDTSVDLDSGQRDTFLNAIRREGNRLRGIKTFDYVVCFRGFIHEAYEFLRILLSEVSRLESVCLRIHVDRLQLSIQSLIAVTEAKTRKPSQYECN